MTSTPEKTLAQRMESLAKADETRLYRAHVKHDLKIGRTSIIQLLDVEEIDPMLKTMKIFDLMLAAPRYGPVTVGHILQECQIGFNKKVGNLTPRQRGVIITTLRDNG